MMRATLTDVQKAIEQLGRRDGDGSRSFSFASSHGDYSERSETETDEDRDTDAEDDGRWHKDARAKLAMRAQRENEERQAREAEEQPRVMIPPIDVEVSDESDMEDDDLHTSPRKPRPYSQIAEEDEDADADGEESPTKEPSGVADAHESSESIIVPSERYLVTDDTDVRTATAPSFPEHNLIPPRVDSLRTRSNTPDSTVAPPDQSTAVPTPEPSNDPTPIPPSPEIASSPEPVPLAAASVPIPVSPLTQDFPAAVVAQPAVAPVPNTLRLSEPTPLTTTSAVPSPTASSFVSYGQSSTAGIQQALTTPATTVASLKTSTPHASGTSTPDPAKKAATHPSEWTVDDVVDWLKSKGFDQGVCDKFIGVSCSHPISVCRDTNLCCRARDHRRRSPRARCKHPEVRDWHHRVWEARPHRERDLRAPSSAIRGGSRASRAAGCRLDAHPEVAHALVPLPRLERLPPLAFALALCAKLGAPELQQLAVRPAFAVGPQWERADGSGRTYEPREPPGERRPAGHAADDGEDWLAGVGSWLHPWQRCECRRGSARSVASCAWAWSAEQRRKVASAAALAVAQ